MAGSPTPMFALYLILALNLWGGHRAQEPSCGALPSNAAEAVTSDTWARLPWASLMGEKFQLVSRGDGWRIPGTTQGCIWAMPPILSHSADFVLGEVRGEIYRLGGFSTPEILQFAAALTWTPAVADSLDFQANLFAGLLTPGYPTSVTIGEGPGAVRNEQVLSAWRPGRPADWPDSARIDVNGYHRIVVTTFTELGGQWTARSFAFVFGEKHQLLGSALLAKVEL